MRIVGGKAKGTILLSPAGKNTTRPTLGRVRESIFNVLANVGLEEAKVLDIFAGTGAMGLEALSRGAAEAVFIDRTTSDIIRKNAERCHMSGQVKVIARDVTPALKLLGGKSFDYIFMDPPYRKGYINEILKEILSCGICSDDAIIVGLDFVFVGCAFIDSGNESFPNARFVPANKQIVLAFNPIIEIAYN